MWKNGTFASQNVQNPPGSDHFWQLRCRKIARCCKSKCTKHTRFGPLLGVTMWKNGTFASQNVQNPPGSDHFWQLRCGKMPAAVARSTFASQNVKNTSASDHFFKFRCAKFARRCGEKRVSKLKCQRTDGLGPLFEVAMSKNGMLR